MEELLPADLNPAPGANEHGTGRTGVKETDAPYIPAPQPWQGGDIPVGAELPCRSRLEREEAFPPGVGEPKLFKCLS